MRDGIGLDLAASSVTPPGTAPLLAIEGLTVAFDGVPALRGIDLAIGHGEAFGLVGESGCGKSVTMLAALGLLPPAARIGGSARLDGAELLGAPPAVLDTVRGGRVAMIFQDPASALNPVHRVGAQVVEALRLHRGMDGAAARAEARRLFDLVGIPDPTRRLEAYPHEMSGGQNQRVMIAMALAGNPELLIADEPTTALDATIQAQILDLLRRVQRETGMALVLISHDLGVIADLCSRVAVMYAGRIVEQATAEALFARPGHPYTQGLLGALPDMIGPRRRLAAIEGSVPEPWAMPPGCAFAPRCALAVAACERGVPELLAVVACERGVPELQAVDADAAPGAMPPPSAAPTPIVIPGLVPGIPTGTGGAGRSSSRGAGAGGDPRDKPGDDDGGGDDEAAGGDEAGGGDARASDRDATRDHMVACIRSDFAAAYPAPGVPAAHPAPAAAPTPTPTPAPATPAGAAA